MTNSQLKTLLELKVEEYNIPGFIPLDPVSIPHKYSEKQDIEITAFCQTPNAICNPAVAIGGTSAAAIAAPARADDKCRRVCA